MAYSPAANITTGNLSNLTQVYLSRITGYDCKILPIAPSVSDPAALGVNSVIAKDKITNRTVFAGHFPEGEDIENIAREIRKTSALITLKDYRPSVDMVEYIIKLKKEQEELHFKENSL